VDELAWVTSYEVHYRHHLTNRWHLLVVTAANTDALGEVVLDLRPHFNTRDGVLTRCLRIRPLTYHRRPTMRVSVYGVEPSQAEGPSLSTAASSDGTSTASAAKDEEVPTIEYCLVGTRSQGEARYVGDRLRRRFGFYRDDYYFYNYGKDRKASKNKEWLATILAAERERGWCDKSHFLDHL
jgi:hypothetical protein